MVNRMAQMGIVALGITALSCWGCSKPAPEPPSGGGGQVSKDAGGGAADEAPAPPRTPRSGSSVARSVGKVMRKVGTGGGADFGGPFGAPSGRARIMQAKSQIGLLHTTLETYQVDIGRYPATNEGLDALLKPPADASVREKWRGPYISRGVPSDPWGNPYRYKSPGTHNPDSFDLWSAGPDGQDGTPDDIGNW